MTRRRIRFATLRTLLTAGLAISSACGGNPPTRAILYYRDPMHPAYTSDKPGKAPDCGMDLVPVYATSAPPSQAQGDAIIRVNPISVD